MLSFLSKKNLVAILVIAIFLGVLDGVGFLYSELQNNNNGEYIDTLTGGG